jgi:hypothetical protein
MDIHRLVQQFLLLEGASVGIGPKHPITPNSPSASEVEVFLNDYSFLRRDQGYVDFLESYAGGHLTPSDHRLGIDIFGFDNQSSHIINLEGAIVDEQGFLTICDGYIHILENKSTNVKPLSFAFDASGKRRWGIYYPTEERWYCESFMAWFELLVTRKGRLL